MYGTSGVIHVWYNRCDSCMVHVWYREKTTGLRFAILPPAGQRSQKKTSLDKT